MTIVEKGISRDDEWDDFLKRSPMGQFQQSAMWAKYKEHAGWSTYRTVIEKDRHIIGGFQLLIRKTPLGNIGYISKGPVFLDEDKSDIEMIVGSIFDVIRERTIRAIVMQPPDDSLMTREVFKNHGFIEIPGHEVIDATLLFPLDGGKEHIDKRMTSTSRYSIRQGIRKGVLIREATMDDIPIFFEMMSASCKRQGIRTPNPGSVEALKNLWNVFYGKGCLRLTLAEYNGEPVASLLCINFANRVTFWKKGWSGKGRGMNPNDALYYEAMLWAHKNGYAIVDFAGIDREIAETIIDGHRLTEKQKSGRDYFNLRLGGIPKLLPKAVIYIDSPVARRAFKAVVTTNLYGRIGKMITH